MKITKSQLKQIIKEELESVLAEEEAGTYRIVWDKKEGKMGNTFWVTVVGTHPETRKVVISTKAQGKTRDEAMKKAHEDLKIKLANWQKRLQQKKN